MDNDIQFGEVEHSSPDVELRPDQNRHYAVVPYDDPESVDLPIYVDIDVLRDMEEHAQTDTSVELGGVMLGGQYEDEDGNPFVVVTDSLRAKHYESTKGSFKFTHDTWSEITRQRNEFPDELQMVGWYHTHPGWGIFLSGMDMFICDNFFNRDLDIAFVIDPCALDRGMFHWTGQPNERIRQNGGFYLMASRFREEELLVYADQLKGNFSMAPTSSGFGAPVVNVHEAHTPQWQSQAILGMLGMQFLFMTLVAWKLLFPGEGTTKAEKLDKVAQAIIDRDESRATVKAQEQLIQQTLQSLEKDGKPLSYQALLDMRKEIDRLKSSNAGHANRNTQLKEEVKSVNRSLKAANNKVATLTGDLKVLKKFKYKLDKLENKGKDKKDGKKKKDDKDDTATNWVLYIGLGALGVAAVLAAAMSLFGRREDDLRHPEEPVFEDNEEGDESKNSG